MKKKPTPGERIARHLNGWSGLPANRTRIARMIDRACRLAARQGFVYGACPLTEPPAVLLSRRGGKATKGKDSHARAHPSRR